MYEFHIFSSHTEWDLLSSLFNNNETFWNRSAVELNQRDSVDGVKVALGSRGMTVEVARQCANDRKEWRAPVHMWMIECDATIFAWFLCSFGPPSLSLVAYYLERGGMPLHGDAVGVNCKKGAATGIRAQVPSICAEG